MYPGVRDSSPGPTFSFTNAAFESTACFYSFRVETQKLDALQIGAGRRIII